MRPCKPAVILAKAKFLYSRDKESRAGLYLNTAGVYRQIGQQHKAQLGQNVDMRDGSLVFQGECKAVCVVQHVREARVKGSK